jgi:RNA polymerase sigma-70 factor (ECF subfamily)
MAIYVDDRELLAAHRAGDTEAFEELAREYHSALYGHAYKRLMCNESAEDAVQETLVRAYRALPNFGGEHRLGPWLHRIMANVCLDEAKRRLKEVDKTERVAALPSSRSEVPSVEDQLGLSDVDIDIDSALLGLNESHREAFSLRFVDEMEYKEVAAASGTSEQNARARVSRARVSLRAALKGVAVVPIFLWGLVYRGEKASAAATSGSNLAASPVLGVSGSASSSVLGTTFPVISEAAVVVAQAASTVTPVIAKAAVGIGLAAAVLSPASDSAVHQAVESFSAPQEIMIVSEISETLELSEDDLLALPVMVTSSTDPETVLSSMEILDDSEEASLSSTALVPQVSKSEIAESAEIEFFLEAMLEGQYITFRHVGGDRYSLEGDLKFGTEGSIVSGALSQDSRIRLSPEEGDSSSYRVDGLLVVEMDGNQQFDLRIAGLGSESAESVSFVGVYRANFESQDISDDGSVIGSMEIGDDGRAGSVTLRLVP